MDKQKVYKIRPHHGMCLAYFEGKGYSQGFVRHMGEILSLLEEGALVEMTVAGDNICSACPNLKDGVCETADKVETYDRAVLSFCDLKENEQLDFSEFTQRFWNQEKGRKSAEIVSGMKSAEAGKADGKIRKQKLGEIDIKRRHFFY